MSKDDSVRRRLTIEFGSQYVYAYLTTAAGRILDEEVWREPVRLEVSEVHEGATEAWAAIYQHFQDTLVFPSASTGGSQDSVEEDHDPPQD